MRDLKPGTRVGLTMVSGAYYEGVFVLEDKKGRVVLADVVALDKDGHQKPPFTRARRRFLRVADVQAIPRRTKKERMAGR